MKKKGTLEDNIISIILGIICILLMVFALYPILNVVSLSLSSDVHVMANDITFYPKQLTFTAYKAVLENDKILRSFSNSIYISLMGCICSLMATILASYPLAFCQFPGKKLYNIIVLLPMWFVAGMIPTYMCVSKLNLVNTYWSLILVNLVAPYNVVIMMNFMKGLPKEIIESARIDGAGEWRILFQIVVPLSKASIATISLWVIAAHWNAYMDPLLYISDFDKFTLQQVLRDIVLNAEAVKYELGNASSNSVIGMGLADQLKNAVLVVSMIPMLCIYPFIQKYFVQGVTMGAVKG